ncbi:MAG: DUF3048 domain-containing protein, partial [Patescibacteria group bacterium]|nr:DUF3048 domain-containing protein [Patescibacteria group bacterium]
MKKQNQPVSFALRSIQHRHVALVAIVFFCIATAFAWWFCCSYAAAQTHVMRYYLWGSDNRFVTGGSAAMVDIAQGDTGLVARLLDGVMVAEDTAHYWPYAVMIENLPSVRPQKGLSQASVVYETLAEGGATRFMAVFDPSGIVPEIMPVRSARPYYIEWVSEYGALYAHAGGSPKALTVIKENADINNLEALSRDAVYFWRDQTIGAPHNLVTSSEKMTFALRDKGLDTKEAVFRPWQFKDDAPLEARGETGKTVGFNFSYGLSYKVGF